MAKQDQLFTRRAAAREAGVSYETLQRYERRGEVRPLKLNSGDPVYQRQHIEQARRLFKQNTSKVGRRR